MRDMSSGLQGLGEKGSYWRDGKLYSVMNDPQYGYLMPDGTPDTRWQTAPIRVGGAINEKLTDGVFGLIEGGRYLKDIDYATIPDKILGSLEKGAADLTVGAIEGGRYLKDRYNAAENWLDDKYDAVADWYNPPWERTSNPRTYDRGPLSRTPMAIEEAVPGKAMADTLANDFKMRQMMGSGPHYDTTSYSGGGGYGSGWAYPYIPPNPPFGPHYNAQEATIFNPTASNLAERADMVHGPGMSGTDTRSDWQKWKDSFKGSGAR